MVILELIKIDLVLLNAALLNAILFVSQSDLPLDGRKLPI